MGSNSFAGFKIKGKPVNPACLAMINNSLADFPFIYEINMDRCQNSNAAFDGNNGTTSYKHVGCTYSYRVVGKTENGIYVISTTRSCDSGSGVFTDSILVRLMKKRNSYTGRYYNALVYLGSLGGGDRATGSYKQLKVVGNKVVGFRYSDHNPATRKIYPDKRVLVDLSRV